MSDVAGPASGIAIANPLASNVPAVTAIPAVHLQPVQNVALPTADLPVVRRLKTVDGLKVTARAHFPACQFDQHVSYTTSLTLMAMGIFICKLHLLYGASAAAQPCI